MTLGLSRPALHDPLTASLQAQVGLPSLAAGRLCLRWLDQDDTEALYRIFSDQDALRFWSHPPFDSRDDASIYLETIHRGYERGTLFQWGAVVAGDNEVIGTCTLAQIDPIQGRADVGFMLGRPHWGHGYGREMVGALLLHAFADLGLRRLEADVDPRNLPSLALLERLGFKREGYLRQRWLVNGELQDSVVLGLLAGDFPPAD
ncbi:GNAT family N-acetyltransferase [Arenimonas oryziterrae]|uniref:N-acetyltransferase domain-containing protein n=1 Tax=Arenimonas oryziterrae DSM 21050 = YC6267 TaxID=1121015 RepID=A0A091APY7_9GAMM|nr:GNAT family N-acetyltransferase [Arenimonas oryziterrae]KFN41217.1 hypothetical protein N789_04840 [Arenimonas oryziterrae DSM 21050 = YC6267]